MVPKDYYTIIISVIALIVSIFLNFFQRAKDEKRSTRKDLSDTLESIAKINIENTKLRQNNVEATPEIIELRRNYNSQRRILIAHADFLISNYDDIVIDIDCNIAAGAYKTIGDYDKAELYWKKTIEKSDSAPIKHMNLRGYGTFLFEQGKIEAGRSKFREALLIDLPDSDASKSLITDTYLMWAKLERDFNYESEAIRLIGDAVNTCSRIGNRNTKAEREKQIQQVLSTITIKKGQI
jgi:tetratricopeptide (TPR) repeat protein